MFQLFLNFLTFVGFYAFGCYLYDNLRSPYQIFCHALQKLRKPNEVKSLKERFGNWAVVTGASDGIGKAYALELARKGLNIVLIARNEEKLRKVATECAIESHVETKIIIADFTHGPQVYEHIEKELGDLPIGILVNNVGITTSKPGPMAKFSAEELWNVIYTNIAPVTQLSRLFLRRMRDMKIKGVIVNISSGTELQPIPYAAIYGATKAYIRSLTLSLQYEAEPYGITVQLVSPHFVVTKINSYSKYVMRGGLFIPYPAQYVKWAVDTIGTCDETSGYFWHAVENTIAKLFPARLRTFLFVKMAENLVIDDMSKEKKKN